MNTIIKSIARTALTMAAGAAAARATGKIFDTVFPSKKWWKK